MIETSESFWDFFSAVPASLMCTISTEVLASVEVSEPRLKKRFICERVCFKKGARLLSNRMEKYF